MKDEESKLMDSRWFGQSLCALAVVFAVGCGHDSTENFLSQTPQTSVELTDGTTLEVVASSGSVVSLRTSDGQTVPLERGTAVVGDELVVRAPDGRLEAYRQPTAINEELDKLPYVYLQEGSLKPLVTDGCLGEPYVHPGDKSFYWTARTCTNPDCDSQTMRTGDQPYLFIHRLTGVKLMADDRVDFTGVPPSEIDAPILCPVCGKKEYIIEHAPAESAERKLALAEELERVRSARDLAARSH